MTDPLTWQAVVSKLIDHLPAILAALAGCLAYWQSRQNGVQVTTRSNSQDKKLDDIHEATNGGVQALRDTIKTLQNKAIVDTARIDDLEALVKRFADAKLVP